MADKRRTTIEHTKQKIGDHIMPLQQMKGENKKDHHGDVKLNSIDENSKRGTKIIKSKASYEPYQVKKNCKSDSMDNKKRVEEKQEPKQIQFCLTVTEKSYKLGDTRICKTKTDCKPCEVTSSTNRKHYGRDKKYGPTSNEEFCKAKSSKVSKSKGNYKPYPVKANNVIKAPKIEKTKHSQPSVRLVSDINKQVKNDSKTKTESSFKSINPNSLSSSVISKSQSDTDCGYDIYLTPAQRRKLSSNNVEQTKPKGNSFVELNDNYWQKKPKNGRSYTNKQKQLQSQRKKNENLNLSKNNHLSNEKKKTYNKKGNMKNTINERNKIDKVIEFQNADKDKQKFSDTKKNTIKVLGEVLAQVCEKNRSFDRKLNENRNIQKFSHDENQLSICYETIEKLISTVEETLAGKKEIVHSVFIDQNIPRIDKTSYPYIDSKINSIITNKHSPKESLKSVSMDDSTVLYKNEKLEPQSNDTLLSSSIEAKKKLYEVDGLHEKHTETSSSVFMTNMKSSGSVEAPKHKNEVSISLRSGNNEIHVNVKLPDKLKKSSSISIKEKEELFLGDDIVQPPVDISQHNHVNRDVNHVNKCNEYTCAQSKCDANCKVEFVQNNKEICERSEFNSHKKNSSVQGWNLNRINLNKRNSEPLQINTVQQINTLSSEQIKIIKKIDNRRRVQGIGILECPCSLSLDGERIGFCDGHELFCQS